MNKSIFILGFCLLMSGVSFSQSDFIGFGFRTGLSYSRIKGPSEVTVDGQKLESTKMTSGFHIGMLVNFKFTDIMGLRTELMYNQRGTKYTFDGPSYYILGRYTLLNAKVEGHRHQSLNITNAYVDIPLLGYYKLGKLELFAGVNAGLLLASTATGSLDFDGISPATGHAITPFTVRMNYNYKSDKAMEASTTTQLVSVDGRNYSVPQATGAYYDYTTKDKQWFKTLDFGLVFGAAFYINQGLFVTGRYILGLGDVDRNEYDISYQALDSQGGNIPRADTNKSQSWQFSVGFSF